MIAFTKKNPIVMLTASLRKMETRVAANTPEGRLQGDFLVLIDNELAQNRPADHADHRAPHPALLTP
jgi:hypothetical protein